jgi:uncharacterized protein
MKRKQVIFFVLIASGLSMWLSSCSDDNGTETPDFDRTVMLQNISENLIVPAYSDLSTDIGSLQASATAFTQNPSTATLSTVQETWEAAYVSWQYANAYNFGPGGEEGLRKGLIEEVGTFPVSESKIEGFITSGTYNLSDFNRDARGFLAIEYLLFSLSDNQQAVVDLYVSANRKKYLNDLISNVKTRIDDALAGWNESYKASFVSNNGTSVGSSTSYLYNEFVRSFESIKNFKVGLPLGKRPGQTQTEPDLVEAYYSGKSVKMFKAHIQAVENIWYGRKKDGTDGVGFEEYLSNVTGGDALITSTKAQLEALKSTMNTIPESPRFSSQLESAPTPIDAFHTELQKHTRYFKSDMSSLLGIAITFSSGDGD